MTEEYKYKVKWSSRFKKDYKLAIKRGSVILCLFTSYESGDISTRVRIEPSSENGLQKVSYVMTDKIVN